MAKADMSEKMKACEERMQKFDRKAPGEGLEILTDICSGKAFLECRLYLQQVQEKDATEQQYKLPLLESEAKYLDICIWNREGVLVFYSRHPLWSGQVVKGILLHPHLWNGLEDPYQYRVKAILVNEMGEVTDVLERMLACYSLRFIPEKGRFLNDKLIAVRAVKYEIPKSEKTLAGQGISERRFLKVRMDREVELVKGMGANAICLAKSLGEEERNEEAVKMLAQICEEKGLFLWHQGDVTAVGTDGEMPCFLDDRSGLVETEKRVPTEQYYYYKAKWSKEPFVHISAESLMLQQNGCARVMVYSNQRRVALYVDGVLFEFRTEGPDFVFEEIPVKQLPLMLTAETGERSMSITAYPIHKAPLQ